MRLGIRWKLLIGIGAPLTALLTTLLALSFLEARKDAVRRMEEYLSKESQFYAAKFDTQLQMFAQMARSMAAFLDNHPDVAEPELYEMLRRNVQQNSLIYGSCVAFEPYTFKADRRLFAPYVYRGTGIEPERGPDGLLRMDVADAYDYMDPKWDWFHGPRTTGKPMWTEPFFDQGAGNVIMCTYVAPFFKDGKFRGTVNMDVRLEDLQQFAGTIQDKDVWISILSRKGTIISWPDPAAIMHETISSLAAKLGRNDIEMLGRRMRAGLTSTERLEALDETGDTLIAYAPIPSTGWSLGVATAESKIMAPVYSGLGNRAVAIASGMAIIILLVLGVGVWLTRPIERLAEAVQVLGSGRLDAPPVRARSNDEIGDLGRAFNTMVAQLREHVAALTRETRAREAVESELRVARDIQRSLLPRVFPPFPDHAEFDLHAFNGAAHGVAGDFYDFFFLPGGRLALVIADVCGKGIPAAMFMAVARTVIRNLAMSGRSPGDLLTEANRVLLADNAEGLFVTGIVAYYDPLTGDAAYANGGHPPPYILAPDGSSRPFGKVTGTVVGAMSHLVWTEAQEHLRVGEEIVMYTDGVPDARRPGGPMFGEGRLTALLAELPGLSTDQVCDRIVERLAEFAGDDWADDVTLLVLRRVA